MRLDGNRSLRNLKFYFGIEIFCQYKVSVLVEDLLSSPGGKYPVGMVIFQDGEEIKQVSLRKDNVKNS